MSDREVRKIGYDNYGLKCPNCGCTHFKTKISRPEEHYVYRYKACRNCNYRIHTTETIDEDRSGIS